MGTAKGSSIAQQPHCGLDEMNRVARRQPAAGRPWHDIAVPLHVNSLRKMLALEAAISAVFNGAFPTQAAMLATNMRTLRKLTSPGQSACAGSRRPAPPAPAASARGRLRGCRSRAGLRGQRWWVRVGG